MDYRTSRAIWTRAPKLFLSGRFWNCTNYCNVSKFSDSNETSETLCSRKDSTCRKIHEQGSDSAHQALDSDQTEQRNVTAVQFVV
jgi:hypothetical protein